MDAETGYDTTNLHALRQELKRLNDDALEAGLIAPREGRSGAPAPGAPLERAQTRSTDKGKAGARRLLMMLARGTDDESPAVPGTDFTEAGVVRLLAHLHKPRSRGRRFLHRLRRFLTRPVAAGMPTSAGVSVERLQVVSRQLLEIEARGWDYFQSIRAARHGRQTSPSRSDPPGIRRPATAPASPRAPKSGARRPQ